MRGVSLYFSLIYTGIIKRKIEALEVWNMAAVRLSKTQKQSLLAIYYIELGYGMHTPVNTGYLRKKVDEHLGNQTPPANFRGSLHALAERDYLVFQKNSEQLINDNVRSDEYMWQLTETGRQWAEAAHCKALTPKRRYIKSGNHTNEAKRLRSKKKKA